MTAHKTHGCIRHTPISAGQSTYIKRDEINIMNIINDKTFNQQNNPFNKDNRYMEVTLKSKLIRVAWELISADNHYF